MWIKGCPIGTKSISKLSQKGTNRANLLRLPFFAWVQKNLESSVFLTFLKKLPFLYTYKKIWAFCFLSFSWKVFWVHLLHSLSGTTNLQTAQRTVAGGFWWSLQNVFVFWFLCFLRVPSTFSEAFSEKTNTFCTWFWCQNPSKPHPRQFSKNFGKEKQVKRRSLASSKSSSSSWFPFCCSFS